MRKRSDDDYDETVGFTNETDVERSIKLVNNNLNIIRALGACYSNLINSCIEEKKQQIKNYSEKVKASLNTVT